VKTIIGWERTPFHITRNELAVAEEQRSDWALVRLWNFKRGQRRSSSAIARSSSITDRDCQSREFVLTNTPAFPWRMVTADFFKPVACFFI